MAQALILLIHVFTSSMAMEETFEPSVLIQLIRKIPTGRRKEVADENACSEDMLNSAY
jgi:hypothetical protein